MSLDVEKLKRLRVKKEWTQAQAAEATGVGSAQRWNNIERGRDTNITLDTLNKIAAALGVKAKDLLK